MRNEASRVLGFQRKQHAQEVKGLDQKWQGGAFGSRNWEISDRQLPKQ